MTQSIDALIEREYLRWNVKRETVKNAFYKKNQPNPVITISRMLASGASEIAVAVAKELDCRLLGIRIMDEVAKQSNTQKEMVDAMDERVSSQLKEWIDKVFRNRTVVDSDVHHRHLLKTINYFMEEGHVVLLGRGAGFMPKVVPRLDVRIVASNQYRTHRLMQLKNCTSQEAERLLSQSDTQRAQFIHQVFGENWWDSRQYDLTINTENIPVDGAVAMIKAAWTNIADNAVDKGERISITAHS